MGYKEYTSEELRQFRLKDKRMSLSGLVQALLQAGANVYDIKANVELARIYSNKIYEIAEEEVANESEKTIEVPSVSEWVLAAQRGSLPEPTAKEQEMLDLVVEGADGSKEEILLSIYKKWGAYPTKKQSVKKCLNHLTNLGDRK